MWRLRNDVGRVHSCELRDNTQAGGRWDVLLLENGEPLLSPRCTDEALARFVPTSVKQDLSRTDWAGDAAGS